MPAFSSNISLGIKRLFSPSRTIILDGRVSLEEEPSHFFEKLAVAVGRIKKDQGGEIEIDLRGADFIYPSSLIFLLALSETLGTKVRINLIVTKLSPIHEYLIFSGFADKFSVPPIDENFRPSLVKADVLKLETGREVPGTQQKALWFVERVAKVRALNKTFEGTAVDSVDEILRNVQQHSACSKWYGLGQVFPNSQKVRFVIYDNGDGIKKHLSRGKYSKKHPLFRKMVTQNQYRQLRDSAANFAIKTAATYMVSGTDYKENSGAGIHFLIDDFGRAFTGTVSILSGNGLVIWHSGEIKHDLELPFEIQGTMVSITAKGLNL